MEIFIVVTLFSLLIFSLLMFFLVWGVHSGQWDDLTTPKDRILWDDPPAPENKTEKAREVLNGR